MTLQTRGSDIVDGDGEAIRLKGVNIGGWLNMVRFSDAARRPRARARLERPPETAAFVEEQRS